MALQSKKPQKQQYGKKAIEHKHTILTGDGGDKLALTCFNFIPNPIIIIAFQFKLPIYSENANSAGNKSSKKSMSIQLIVTNRE